MRTSSNGKALYFITFIDDYSRWCEIHFLKTKNEALEAIKKYKSYAKRKTGALIQSLQSDNRGRVYQQDLRRLSGAARNQTKAHHSAHSGAERSCGKAQSHDRGNGSLYTSGIEVIRVLLG